MTGMTEENRSAPDASRRNRAVDILYKERFSIPEGRGECQTRPESGILRAMRTTAAVAVLALLLAIPSSAGAVCMACTESYGVKIHLKDGSIMRGYIEWNVFMLEGLVRPAPREVRPYHRDLVEKMQRENPADILDWGAPFDNWIALMNATFQQDAELQELSDSVRAYGELERIHLPHTVTVAVEGTFRALGPAEIQSIETDLELSSRFVTTGLDVLPKEAIRLLQTTEPRYTIEHESSVDSQVYVVYTDLIPPARLLDHILYESRGMPGAIVLNGVKVVESRANRSARREPASARDRAAVDYFVGKLEEWGPSWQRTEEELVSIYGRSLGDKRALRALGIITFRYAWD